MQRYLAGWALEHGPGHEMVVNSLGSRSVNDNVQVTSTRIHSSFSPQPPTISCHLCCPTLCSSFRHFLQLTFLLPFHPMQTHLAPFLSSTTAALQMPNCTHTHALFRYFAPAKAFSHFDRCVVQLRTLSRSSDLPSFAFSSSFSPLHPSFFAPCLSPNQAKQTGHQDGPRNRPHGL
jgi:hypothetical protein